MQTHHIYLTNNNKITHKGTIKESARVIYCYENDNKKPENERETLKYTIPLSNILYIEHEDMKEKTFSVNFDDYSLNKVNYNK